MALRTLNQTAYSRVPPQQIRRAINALIEKLRDVKDPLTELKLYAHGKRIRVELEGRAMEAESGQLLLDFDPGELSRLLEFRPKENHRAEREQRQGRRALVPAGSGSGGHWRAPLPKSLKRTRRRSNLIRDPRER